MTQQAETSLRNSLNQIDRERKRIKVLLFTFFLLTFVPWFAMIFSKNDHVGIPYGLTTVMMSVYVAGMMVAKISTDNTRAILKAIELLGGRTPTE